MSGSFSFVRSSQANRAQVVLLPILLSAVLVAGHLLPGLDQTKIEDGIRNSLHIIAFAIFGGFIFAWLRATGASRAIMVTLILVVLVGGLAEMLQYFRGTTPDWRDFARDLIGACLAIAIVSIWHQTNIDTHSRASRLSLRVISTLLAFVVVAPLMYWISVIIIARLAFPMLASFDAQWEKHTYFLINAELSSHDDPSVGSIGAGKAASFELLRTRKTGLSLMPVAHDWSNLEYLVFVASIDQGPDTTISVRINDKNRYRRYSDPFSRAVLVTRSPKLFRLRLSELAAEPGFRDMDLTDIRQITFLVPRRKSDTRIVFDEIRLE